MNLYTYFYKKGNNIHLIEKKDGTNFNRRIKYSPSLFRVISGNSHIRTKYRTLDGRYAKKYTYDSMNEAYKNKRSDEYFGMSQFEYAFISDRYPEPIEYNESDISIAVLDIETSSDYGFPDFNNPIEEVTAITLKYSDIYYVFGTQEYTVNQNLVSNGIIQYTHCNDEIDLLKKFVDTFASRPPDILTGWNIELFDIPYLKHRMDVLLPTKFDRLSPYNEIKSYTIKNAFEGEDQAYMIRGVSVLDYLRVYKKAPLPKLESYKLDFVAHHELNTKKLDYSEYGSLRNLYKENYQKFIDYNIIDCELIHKLEAKLKLINIFISIAYLAKCNFEDVFSPVRVWDIMIFNFLKQKHIVIPPNVNEKKERYPGAYVKNPIVGHYEWIMSFDIKSLYPNIIISHNISPETKKHEKAENVVISKLVNEESKFPKDDRYIGSASGTYYEKDSVGVIPYLVDLMIKERFRYKKMMSECEMKLHQLKNDGLADTPEYKQTQLDSAKFDNFQMVRKILANSVYGAMGNPYFRYYDIENAKAITITGQFINKRIAFKFNKLFNTMFKTNGEDYIIYMDTDSNYINITSLVESLKNKYPYLEDKRLVSIISDFGDITLQNNLKKWFNEIAEEFNISNHTFAMAREVIAKGAVWTAKKRYILAVIDDEGKYYDPVKIKVTGMESKRSNIPQVTRNYLEQAYRIILCSDVQTLKKQINIWKNEFMNMSLNDIAIPSSISNIEKFKDNNTLYRHGSTREAKSSIIFNELLKKNKLEHKFESIKNGDKIKILHIKRSGLLNYKYIAFKETLPDEFGLNDLIDKKKQWEKTFMVPIETLSNIIDWNISNTPNLLQMF